MDNNGIKLTDAQKELLALLEVFSKPVTMPVINISGSFMQEELEAIVSQLIQIGLIIRFDNNTFGLDPGISAVIMNDLKRINTPERIRSLIEIFNGEDSKDQTDPEISIALFLRAGERKEAAFFAYDSGMKKIATHELSEAMELFKSTLSYLHDFLDDFDSDKLFIAAAIALSDVVMSLRLWFEYPIKHLHSAMQAARRLGDERDLAMLTLHLGRIYCFLNAYQEALTSFKEGMAIVEKLGDEDIQSQSSQLLGIYYFMQGMNRQAVEHFNRVMSSTTYRERQLLDLGIPIFLGNSAALLGQFHRAIGILDSSWRRAILISDHLAARFLRADLGNILLMAGKRKEALSHLEFAVEEAVSHDDTFTLVQAQRGLAYYNFLEGRTNESYGFMKTALSKATLSGQPRPTYHLPWILEMLFTFHQEGREPIREWDFENEIDSALNGINLNLRGVALRIQAKLTTAKHADNLEIRALLEDSQSDLERSGALIEVAKTRVELSRAALHEGNRKEAVNFALKAWEGLSIYGFEDFPDDLKPLIDKQSVYRSQSSGQEILDRYMAVMNEFVPSADSDELSLRLLTVTSKFFQAERGGIFWFDNRKEAQTPILRTAYCLTREEADSDAFSQNMKYISKAYTGNEPIIAQVFIKSPLSGVA